MRHVKVSPILTNLDGWVVPRDIVEPKIVGKNENDVGLSVELGPPLLLREAGVAQCHQEGDQHSSSQIILLQETNFAQKLSQTRFGKTMKNII